MQQISRPNVCVCVRERERCFRGVMESVESDIVGIIYRWMGITHGDIGFLKLVK
jgi:hypothetical protein